jgi:hypothetical protein
MSMLLLIKKTIVFIPFWRILLQRLKFVECCNMQTCSDDKVLILIYLSICMIVATGESQKRVCVPSNEEKEVDRKEVRERLSFYARFLCMASPSYFHFTALFNNLWRDVGFWLEVPSERHSFCNPSRATFTLLLQSLYSSFPFHLSSFS